MRTPYTVLAERDPAAVAAAFAACVRSGLSQSPKVIPSYCMYDAEGSRLFDKITTLPEYYPTRAEESILRAQMRTILSHVCSRALNVVELGSGCGEKTRIMLETLHGAHRSFTYMPIDIDRSVLERLTGAIDGWFPNHPTPFAGCVSDYVEGLDWIDRHQKGECKLVVFLGSNIGNFSPDECEKFLLRLRYSIHPGDFLLIGFDRKKKNIRQIHEAYDDRSNVTRDFNRNLLVRINRELGANFNVESFTHHPYYDPFMGSMVSSLVSTVAQEVSVEALGCRFSFAEGEAMRTEYSRKFSLADIRHNAKLSGFRVLAEYSDDRELFTDSLWTVA